MGTKRSEREDKKLKRCERHKFILRHFFWTHVVNIFVSKSVWVELRQWLNWGMSMSYEFTLGGWIC